MKGTLEMALAWGRKVFSRSTDKLKRSESKTTVSILTKDIEGGVLIVKILGFKNLDTQKQLYCVVEYEKNEVVIHYGQTDTAKLYCY